MSLENTKIAQQVFDTLCWLSESHFRALHVRGKLQLSHTTKEKSALENEGGQMHVNSPVYALQYKDLLFRLFLYITQPALSETKIVIQTHHAVLAVQKCILRHISEERAAVYLHKRKIVTKKVSRYTCMCTAQSGLGKYKSWPIYCCITHS
jgi:hypothetical protein